MLCHIPRKKQAVRIFHILPEWPAIGEAKIQIKLVRRLEPGHGTGF